MANIHTPEPVQPYDVPSYFASLPPFLPPALEAKYSEYSKRYDAFTAEMVKADTDHATAEWERRINAARENPSEANIAQLNQESRDELMKKFAERHGVFEHLRNETVMKFAPDISRDLRPIIERLVASFRARVEADFRAVHTRYRVAFDPGQNQALRAIDRWLWDAFQVLDREQWAAENRYPPGWEAMLPNPGSFASILGGNIAPMAIEPTAPAETPSTHLRTASELVAARV